MPRATSRGAGGLSLRPGSRKPNSRAIGDAQNNTSKSSKDRSALGEITNARVNNEKGKGLRSQVKKGLSSIVNRTRSSTSGTTRTSSSFRSKVCEQIEQSSKNKSKGCKGFDELGNAGPSTSEDSNIQESQSLPSSQEEQSIKTSKETFLKTSSYLYLSDSDSEDYHSADETSPQAKEVLILAKKSHRYFPPPRVSPPEGVQDFDLISAIDVTANSEYAADIFQYYRDREPLFYCPSYLHFQTELTEMMRAILVDWLVEVQESFELNHETLYTAVKLMDLYLSKVKVTREQLQLVGATACLIACKIDERIPPNLDDFVYVCDDAYTRREIMAKEREMVEEVNYDIGYPLSYRFLRRYGRVCKIDMAELTLARYILEMSLMDYQFNVETSESKLAAAALVLSLKIKKIECWEKPFMFYANYTIQDVEPLVQQLLEMMQRPPCEHKKTIRLKYSHRVFHEVAHIAVPDSIQWTVPGCT